MPFVGIGVGVGRQRFRGGVDAQAQAHYDRVIADGGVVPSGLNGVNAFFNAVKTIYATSDITTAVSVGVDAQYLGYKLGAGAGDTSGQAVQKLYSCAGSSGDVVQTTASSQPLLLAHNGANYYKNFAVTGNSCSAPKALTQTDTLEFIAKLDLIDGSFFSGYAIGTLDNASTSRQFYVIYSGGSFGLIYGNGLAQNVTATTTTSAYNGWLRVTLEKSGANSLVKFYKSEETSITNPSLVTWTQIGTTVTGVYAAMATTVTNFNILSGGNSSNASKAKCYYAHIAETIGGSPLSVFNPASYNASTSQTQWTSTTGEVWTINTGTATTGYKGVLVDRTIVQSDGINDRLLSGTLTSKSTFSRYAAMNPLNINTFKGIVGANVDDRHYIYATATDVAIFNGATLTYTSEQAQRQALYEADYNGSSSVALLNNTSSNTGNAGTGSSTALEVFAISGGSYANVILNTLIDRVNAGIDTPTQKTEMYNYIRSINNNAF